MDSISTHNNPPAQAAESSRQPIPYDNSSGAGNPGKRNAEKPSIKKNHWRHNSLFGAFGNINRAYSLDVS